MENVVVGCRKASLKVTRDGITSLMASSAKSYKKHTRCVSRPQTKMKKKIMTDEKRMELMKEEIINSVASLSYVKLLAPPKSELDLFLKDIISDILEAERVIHNMDLNND